MLVAFQFFLESAMNTLTSKIRWIQSVCLTVALCAASVAWADPPLTSATVYPAVPPNITTDSAKPMLMLVASKDHTLFGPMFTDFEDLDGDGTIEVTFKPDFKYYGYFDPTKCYTYTSNIFSPDTNASVSDGRYVCTGKWSGNFLNWATMTRLDILRKILYGGQRYTDSATETILQVARLSQDSHSFVKYYRGEDINDYTPFSKTELTKTGGSNAKVYAGLSMCIRASVNDNGLTSTPQMRLAKGNYRLWATVEKPVCAWSGNFNSKLEGYYGGNKKINGEAITYQGDAGIKHEAKPPTQSGDGVVYGTKSDVDLRIKVCVADKLGEERCQAYGSGGSLVNKPVGLLQEFGTPVAGASAARTEFGLFTGSYDKNLTAGALRKNMTDMLDEIDPATGQFCFSSGASCPTTMASDATREHTATGAIKALDQINLYGRVAGQNDYADSGTQLPSALSNGKLSAWGNPVGEMIVQALRYYAGQASTNPSPTPKDDGVSMPVATWVDPIALSTTVNKDRGAKYGTLGVCRPMNILALSSSALSFDHDDADTVFSSLLASPDLTTVTNLVGQAEGINGSLRSVGDVDNAFGETCAGKTVTSLAKVTGVCSEAPAVKGSYKVAGAALYANTNRIRSLPTGMTNPPEDWSYKVKTFAASLAGGAARIEVKIPGTNPAKYVYITPEGLWASASNAKRMPGAMLTFASISSSAKHGAFIVTWNDSLFGGDYDMDIAGYLRYDILDPVSPSAPYRLKVTTDIINVGAGWSGSHGFSVIGTYNSNSAIGPANYFDGRYLTHRHYENKCPSGYVQEDTGGFDGVILCRLSTFTTPTTKPTPIPTSCTGSPTYCKPPTNDSIISTAAGYLCGNSAYSDATNLATVTLSPAIPPATGNGMHACDVATNYITIRIREKLPKETPPVIIDSPVTLTFEMQGAESVILRDPLWYAAKYGGFKAEDKTNDSAELPDKAKEWDAERNDGKLCDDKNPSMLPCSDGEPDGYYLARRPELLEEWLRNLVTNIVGNANSAPAVSSSQLTTGGYKYVAKFDPAANSGTIEGYTLKTNGKFNDIPDWKAGDKLTNVLPASRVVITNDGNVGKAWRSTSSFSSAYMDALRGVSPAVTPVLTTTQAAQLIDYLRGDDTHEYPAGIWRDRISNIMGSVVNSSPWLQSPPIAKNIGALPSGAPSYTSFVGAQKAREKVIWVGANDGMLHGFKATGTTGGTPVMSFIPSPLVSRLRNMAQDTTSIIAGMDGSPFVGDVLVGGTPAWRSYLFSSLGRGGRAVFALDVTNASELTESNAASIYKWTFSSADDADLGYVVSDQQLHPRSNQATPIVRMNNGKYAILVPNGMGSASGRAYMFVLFVNGSSSGTWTEGTHYIKIATDALSANGMMGVNWADTNNDGTADILYGTDFQGRLWKFDVSSDMPSNWKSAFPEAGGTPLPLFEAHGGTTRLAISTSPVVSFPDFGGMMVGFGTGRSLQSGDFPDFSNTQRFFSIYDRWNSTTTTAVRPLPNSSLATMLRRTTARATVVDAEGKSSEVVYISESENKPFNPVDHDGWYVNFTPLSSGSTINNESVLSSPRPIGGQIFFKTVRPRTVSGVMQVCTNSPESTDYLLDPISGLPEAGLFDVVDVVVDGVTKTVRIVGSPSEDQKSTVVFQVDGKLGTITILGKDGQKRTLSFRIPTRRQWREIPGMRTDQ